MSHALIHGKELARSAREYRISLPGLIIILIVFAAVLPYSLQEHGQAFLILSSLALFGVALGLLAGPPRIDVRFDETSLIYSVLGFAVIGVTSMVTGLVNSLDMSRTLFIYAAVCEELAFRFGVQRFAERVFGPFVALIFQAGVFMLYHWMVYPGYALVAAFPLIAGLVLGMLNMMCKDLTAPLIAHALNNAMVIALGSGW